MRAEAKRAAPEGQPLRISPQGFEREFTLTSQGPRTQAARHRTPKHRVRPKSGLAPVRRPPRAHSRTGAGFASSAFRSQQNAPPAQPNSISFSVTAEQNTCALGRL